MSIESQLSFSQANVQYMYMSIALILRYSQEMEMLGNGVAYRRVAHIVRMDVSFFIFIGATILGRQSVTFYEFVLTLCTFMSSKKEKLENVHLFESDRYWLLIVSETQKGNCIGFHLRLLATNLSGAPKTYSNTHSNSCMSLGQYRRFCCSPHLAACTGETFLPKRPFFDAAGLLTPPKRRVHTKTCTREFAEAIDYY